MVDKGDIGTWVGGLLGVGGGIALGLGPLGVGLLGVATSYAGHHLAEPHHYKPMYSHK